MQISPINISQLEQLLLKEHQENERNESQTRKLHFQKRIAHSERQIDHLQDQQKNAFRSVLWGFFVNIISQASQFIPKFGALTSHFISELGSLLNPFSRKAYDSGLLAETSELESLQEAEQQSNSEEFLRKLTEHHQNIHQNLKQGLSDQQEAQSATTKI